MTLIDLFNGFNELSRRVKFTSDARSLFLAFMQHWNEQRRPQALNITVTVLRQTANLDEEAYRRAAISLSNNGVWKMKRKAHDKSGRIIHIGEIFDQNKDRRGTVAEPAILASPPKPPSEREMEGAPPLPISPETKTETAGADEKPPVEPAGFSIEAFRGRKYSTLTTAEIRFIQSLKPEFYDEVIRILAPDI